MAPYGDIIAREKASALIPVEQASEIIKEAAAASTILKLARKLPNLNSKEKDFPVLAGLPMAYFVEGDTGLKQTTSAEWDKVKITAEELAVIVPVPENVIADTNNYDLWSELRPEIAAAFGIAIDNAMLFGVDKPASWPEAIWAQSIAKSNAVDVPAVTPDYYKLLLEEKGLVSKLEDDGYFVNGYIAHTSIRAKLRGVKDTTGRPIFSGSMQDQSRYDLDGAPIMFPDSGIMGDDKKLMIAGDWRKLVYAIRTDMTAKKFDAGVITDNTGAVKYNLMQQDMVALRVVMRLGFALPNPVSRVKARGERYPFAVLKAAG